MVSIPFPICLLLALVSLLLPRTLARVACESTSECAELMRPGSECIDNLCTNPFRQGCLRNYLGEEEFPSFRTCNSEDYLAFPEDSNETSLLEICTPSPLGYSEIRIVSQNWESAMFTTWIMQIVLSELFQVPTTIESSGPGRKLNFYDAAMPFSYGALGYDFHALERANQHGGGTCPTEWRLAENAEDYKSCGHAITEVWSGHDATVADMTARGILEPPEGTGVVGKLSWFIPKFLAQQDPSLAHWLGLTGQDNRRRVAETFRVPTTYGDFCSEIVPHNCTEPTIFASRPPADEAEAAKFFVAGGAFNGYFRFTDDNDCDLNPDTCVGHVTDVPCEWTTFVTPQAYHLDLPVQSKGSLEPNSAYTYGQLLDIWAAANATRSPILFYWWYPDPTYQFYLGSDAEMQGVQLPPPRQECVTNRVTPAQRCSDNATERLGAPQGSCDPEAHSLNKLIIANLFHYLNGKQPEEENNHNATANDNRKEKEKSSSSSTTQNPALRSPAYEAIQGLSITELELGEIIDAWERRGLDKWNYDPREAVCEWVVDHLDTLKTWIPRTYPRKVQQEAYNHEKRVLYGFAVAIGVLVSLVVCATGALTYKWRNRPLLVFAQVNFLFFLLFGLELVAIGSVLVAVEPSNVTCALQSWFLILGYTLELVPLIVKVGAIHRMMRAAKKMKRITLDQRQLYMTVLFFVLLAVVFLTVYTAVDPSKRHYKILLHPDRQTESGETIVTVSQFCASENNDSVWRYLSLSWQVILLLCATVLAFQTRNIRQDLNESHTLGVLIYSHFVFVLARVITFLLSSAVADENGDAMIDRNTLEAIRSLLLSLDVFFATAVYFGPKIYGLTKYDDDYFKAMMALQRRQSVHRSSMHRNSMRGGSTSAGLAMYAGSMMNSSVSQFNAHDISADVVSGSVDCKNSSDRNSAIDSSVKRRSSSKLSFIVGDGDIPDTTGEIPWVPAPNLQEHSSRKLTSEDLGKLGFDSHASSGFGPVSSSGVDVPALPMDSENKNSVYSGVSNNSHKDRTKDKRKEAQPERKSRSPNNKGEPIDLTAIENQRFEEAQARWREEVAREKEEIALARAERRVSAESLTKDMWLEMMGLPSSKRDGAESSTSSISGRPPLSSTEDFDEQSARRLSRAPNSSRERSGATISSCENESHPETAPSGKIPPPMSSSLEEEDEKCFERLCNDDKDLGDKHYFF